MEGYIQTAEFKGRKGLELKPIWRLYLSEIDIPIIYIAKNNPLSLLFAVIFKFSDLHTQLSMPTTKTYSIVQNHMLLFWCTSHLLKIFALRGVSGLLKLANGRGSEIAKIKLMLLMDSSLFLNLSSLCDMVCLPVVRGDLFIWQQYI